MFPAITKHANGTSTPNLPRRSHRHRNPYMYFSLFLVVYIFLTQTPRPESMMRSMSLYGDNSNSNNFKQQSSRAPRLGDGCYHVYLDVGANVGVHGRFLLEPEKYPDSWSSVALFEAEYGGADERDNRDICVFEFEANPVHWPRLREVSEAYKAMGWRYHVVEAAVSDTTGVTTFFHQGGNEKNKNEWGFSGAKDLRTVTNRRTGVTKVKEDGYTEEVATIRLSEWIRTHVLERDIPKVPPSSTSLSGHEHSVNVNNSNSTLPRTPILGMKVDIEGYEYVVLPDLIHSGAFCHFDFVFGEFHPKFAPITMFRNNGSTTEDHKSNNNDNDNKNGDSDAVAKRLHHRVVLDERQDAHDYANALRMVMKASRNCLVRWISSDDESYLKDGVPLPIPGYLTRR